MSIAWSHILITLAAMLVCVGASSGPPNVAFVDARASPGGLGTAERPFARLQEALGRPGVDEIRVGPGQYEGPFGVGGPVRITGAAGVVLVTQDEGPILTVQADAALEGLAFESTKPIRVGLLVAENAVARLEGCTFRGAFRRALRVAKNARTTIRHGHFAGTVTAVQLDAAQVRIERTRIEGGEGVALFAGSDSSLELEDVFVEGHEYAVLGRAGARVFARRLRTDKAQRAGVGIVGAAATLAEVVALDSGPYGGIQSVGGALRVENFLVARAKSYGVSAIGGTLSLHDGAIRDIRNPGGGAGDGVHLRRAVADLARVHVKKVAGACVQVAEGARLRMSDSRLEACSVAGLLVETRGDAELRSVEILHVRSEALVALTSARVRLDRVHLHSLGQRVVRADCKQGTAVTGTGVTGLKPEDTDAPCVRFAADMSGRVRD
ncbi:MAG: hypothetical protein ACKVPX_12145 [Myxococcaceae bacterium]